MELNGKILYTTKGAAREYGRIGCNFYTGCPHECEYCYLKRGAPSKQLGGNEVQLKKCFKDKDEAAQRFVYELNKWSKECKEHGLFLSFTTDPMIDETIELTQVAIHNCSLNDIPVRILTKDANFIRNDNFMAFIDRFAPGVRKKIHFGFTLTGHDDMEPKASKNSERILAMRKMAIMGYPTFASIEPVIDWPSSERIIHESVLWCDHYKLGLRSGVKKDYYDISKSGAAILRVVQYCESYNRTLYLKESARKLLKQYLQPGAYEVLLSHTVDMDGNPITCDAQNFE